MQSAKLNSAVLQLFSEQLFKIRVELIDELLAELGQSTQWQTVAGDSVAYAILKPQTTVQELLQFYLKSRMVCDNIYSMQHSNAIV